MAAVAALLTTVVLVLSVLPAPAQTTDEVRVVDTAGRVLVRVTPGPRVYRLADAAGAPLGEVRVEADRVKLRDAAGVERWKIKRKDYGAEIETAAGERLYRLRARGSQWRVEDAAKAEVARVAASGSPDERARAWLAQERFSPVERAALWTYFTTVGR